jgi:hypothetical protein
MKDWQQVEVSAVITGTIASLVSSTALAMLAKLEGKSAVQPINATSHWLHGEDAAKVREADLRHTAIGYATHHGASIFWATLFEALLREAKLGMIRWSETSSFVATAIGGMVAGLALWAFLIARASALLEGAMPPSGSSLESTAPVPAHPAEERTTDRSIRVVAAIGQ